MERAQLLLNRLHCNRLWQSRALKNGEFLSLGSQLKQRLCQAHSALEVALSQARDVMIHHPRVKKAARDLGQGFRKSFVPNTLQLPTIIGSRFAGKKFMFAYNAMDLHENRVRQREAAYRQRHRALKKDESPSTQANPPTPPTQQPV